MKVSWEYLLYKTTTFLVVLLGGSTGEGKQAVLGNVLRHPDLQLNQIPNQVVVAVAMYS